METLQQEENQPKDNELALEVPEGNSFPEQLIRQVIKGYRDQWNKHNDKYEIDYDMGITTHKVATPDGNKDVAYLRIDRHIRPVLPTNKVDDDNNWETKLIHQEVYFFRDIRERVNPKAPWKEQLYLNALARLIGAGLEYAELLQRLKNVEQGKSIAEQTQERAQAIGLDVAQALPSPLTKEDEEYKMWLNKEREKEGLTTK